MTIEPALPRFWRRDGVRLILAIHAQPGASRTSVVGLHGDALKVRVRAQPIEGRANQELIEFVARLTGARRANVELVSGASSRKKVFAVTGGSIDDAALARLASG